MAKLCIPFGFTCLKNNPDVTEAMIQDFIYENPQVLGLGDIFPLVKEKQQPAGGRLDLYMGNDDGQRYEIEIQLGDTDPSHIIRTIEYRDNERKRYPNFDHCAVIIAENITGRFMNVISLFNGHIPLIAIKLQAYKDGENYKLIFTKILDRVTLGSEDEDITEITDRNYWEKRSSKKMLELTDQIFKDLGEFTKDYELKYNKFYVGLTKDGVAKNFISFKPQKKQLLLRMKGEKSEENDKILDETGLLYNYNSNGGARYYAVTIRSISDFRDNKDLLYKIIKPSYEKFND